MYYVCTLDMKRSVLGCCTCRIRFLVQNLTERCLKCGNQVPLQTLRDHVGTCYGRYVHMYCSVMLFVCVCVRAPLPSNQSFYGLTAGY